MRTLLIVLAVAAVMAVAVSRATATAPGTNGKIAYRTYFDVQQTRGAVFVMEPDGSGKRQISKPGRGVVDDQPSWAPDGSLVAFTRCAPDLPCHVVVESPDGGRARQLGKACPPGSDETTCPDDENVSFSPSSRRIAFVQSTGVVRNVRTATPGSSTRR